MKKIILFSIIFVSLLAFLNYKNSPKQVVQLSSITPSPTPTEIPWQTYRNEKYGFEFQYPSNWTIVDVDNYIDKNPKTPTTAPMLARQIVMTLNSDPNKPYDSNFQQLSLFIIDNPKKLSLKKYFIDQRWSKEWLDLMEETSINNLESVNLKGLDGKSSNYYINTGNHIINLNFSFFDYNSKFTIPPQQTFDQILSTFKLLPDTTTWKTYKNINNDLNFTIKLPPGWFFKKETTVDGQATVWFSKVSKNKTPSSRHDLEIIVGSPFVYSTSGDVCANQWCEDEGSFPVQIENNSLVAYVTRASGGKNKEFERYSFRIDNLPNPYLNIRGTFFTDQEKEEIAQILSTFKFLPDTSTWKTYKNKEFGFEFQYPSDQLVINNSIEKTNTGMFMLGFNSGSFNLWIEKPDQIVSTTYLNIPKVSQVKINGIIWDTLFFDPKTPEGGGPQSFYQTKNNGYRYIVHHTRETEQEINQILSTFKFAN